MSWASAAAGGGAKRGGGGGGGAASAAKSSRSFRQIPGGYCKLEALHSMVSGEYTEESTGARTIRQGGHGGKDRHSKVWTARGPRDRRVRLSVATAIRFYDLQDRLGFEQPSKAVDWLLQHAKPAIDSLPPLLHLRPLLFNAHYDLHYIADDYSHTNNYSTSSALSCASTAADSVGAAASTSPANSTDLLRADRRKRRKSGDENQPSSMLSMESWTAAAAAAAAAEKVAAEKVAAEKVAAAAAAAPPTKGGQQNNNPYTKTNTNPYANNTNPNTNLNTNPYANLDTNPYTTITNPYSASANHHPTNIMASTNANTNTTNFSTNPSSEAASIAATSAAASDTYNTLFKQPSFPFLLNNYHFSPLGLLPHAPHFPKDDFLLSEPLARKQFVLGGSSLPGDPSLPPQFPSDKYLLDHPRPSIINHLGPPPPPPPSSPPPPPPRIDISIYNHADIINIHPHYLM